MITETDLIRRAKIFLANCGANAEKISFADSLKCVLLAEMLNKTEPFSPGELELLLKLLRGRSWYKFW